MAQMAEYNLTEDLLDRNLIAGRGEKTALVSGQRRISYRDLLGLVQHNCGLESLGRLQPGDLVGLLFDDELDSAILLLAVMRLGLVACNLNPSLAVSRLEQQVLVSGCQAVLCSAACWEKAAGLAPQGIAVHSVAPQASQASTSAAVHHGAAQRVAFCLFTSGTTGQPSAVLHRHCDVRTTWLDYATEITRIDSEDIIFTSSKFFYAYGLNALFFALNAGATLVLPPAFLDAEQIWQTLAAERASVFFSVPTIYSRLLNVPQIPELPALRLAVSAGENLPLGILNSWGSRFAAPLIDGIGTTETLSTFISNRPGAIRPGSSGTLVPGFSARVLDDAGHVVAQGQVGVLWIKGDTYLPAYHNAQAASQARFADGWFCTNDLFSQDADGYFYYHGRASEIIKCGGVWIYPTRVEEVLMAHPAVLECAVAAQQQSSGLQRPAAWVVLKSHYSQSGELVEALKGHCKSHLSALEYPHFIYFMDDIPKTTTGKKMRYQLNSPISH